MILKKIIFTHGGGRFGNQLINYIHLSAFGLENKSVSIKQNVLGDYLHPKNGDFIVSNGKIDLLTIVETKSRSKFTKIFFRVLKNSKIRFQHLFAHYFKSNTSLIIGDRGNNIGYLFGKKYNDLNDYNAMKLCGYSACPSDSHKEIIAVSKILLKKKGGTGVVRELLEDVLNINFLKILYSE